MPDTPVIARMVANQVAPQANSVQRLVYVTTVPMSLAFLSGQVGFMSERGFDCSAISSPGQAPPAFAEREHFDVRAIEMRREITPMKDARAVWAICRELHAVRP